MTKLKTITSTAVLLAGSLFSTQASAITAFGTPMNNAYPGMNLYTGSCLTCHANPSGDNIAWFSQYGKILLANGANYDSPGTFPSVLTRSGAADYDNDGFTVDQEIYGGSFANGGLAGNPALSFTGSTAGTGGKEFGLATAPVTLDTLTSSLNNDPYITVPTGHKNIVSGVVDYTLGNVTTGSAAVKLLFNTGGIQTAPTVQFVDTYSGTATVIPATGNINGSWVVGTDGSITVTIADDGVFDLYSNTNPSAFYDPYASPNIIQTRLAITTSSPTTGSVANVGGDGGDEGGLHCMTSGLSTYGFMLFGLLAAGLLAKRKRS